MGPGEAPAAPPGAPVPLPHPRAPLGRAGEAPGPLAGPWGRIIVGVGHEELSRIWSFKGRYDCAVVVTRPKGFPRGTTPTGRDQGRSRELCFFGSKVGPALPPPRC